ncbi:MAG: discoidin domain-containing protein [Clostridia bacterium]|nr:discoidin domain-containing protein [Clostridia bacterium]
MIANFYKNTSDVRVVNKTLIPIAISSTRTKIDDGYYFDTYTVNDPNATASTYHHWYPPLGIVSPYTTSSLNDPDANTCWLPDSADMTPWVQYELPDAKLIDKVKLVCWSNYSADFTCGITISGSNDGITFDTLYTGTITGELLSFTNVEYVFDNDTAYKYIRLSFDAPLSVGYQPSLFTSKLNFNTYHYEIVDDYDLDVIFKADETKNNPTLELAYNSNLDDCNYVHINNYYYYIVDRTYSKNRVIFQLKPDLLMTFKNDILNLGVILARQEHEFNTYLKDTEQAILTKRVVDTREAEHGFNTTDTFILATCGK